VAHVLQAHVLQAHVLQAHVLQAHVLQAHVLQAYVLHCKRNSLHPATEPLQDRGQVDGQKA
jgi:hypothetical protein